MKPLFIIIVLLATSITSYSQQQECGTLDIDPNIGLPPSPPQLNSFAKSIDYGRTFWVNYIAFLPEFGQSAANEEIHINYAKDYIEELNSTFESIGIDFKACDISVVWNDVLSTNSNDGDETAYETYINPKAINIFVPYILNNTGGFAPLFFRANYQQPASERVIFIASGSSKETLIHEMGHFFGLYHPHRGYHNADGSDAQYREFVNGSNCNTHGDEICDTPADPKLSKPGYMFGCNYVGAATDGNGDSFVPDTDLYMSYTNSECRTRFSNEQLGYMYDRIYNYTYNEYLVVPHATCELNSNTGWVMNNNTIHPNGYPANCFIPYTDQPNDSPKNFYSYYVVSNLEFGEDNDIEFQGMKQIQLNPGFKISSENNSKFKAHINSDCSNYSYPWNWYPVDNNFFKMAQSDSSTETVFNKRSQIISKSRERLTNKLSIAVSPNPNEGIFEFSTNLLGGTLIIKSLDGKTALIKEHLSSTEEHIDLSDFPSGVYFVHYNSPNNGGRTKKIFINR